MPKKPKIPELIDFSTLAGLDTEPDPASTTSPRRGRPPGGSLAPKKDSIIYNNNNIEDKNDYRGSHRVKDLLNRKELIFIDNYLTGNMTIEDAMLSAGYVGYHRDSLYRIARKIVRRYEASTEGREIMRSIGFGEISVSRGMQTLARESKSDVVKLRSFELAAKCLGMMEAGPGAGQQVTVIIQALDSPTQVNIQGPAGPGPTNYTHPAPGLPGEPIIITK